MFLHPDEYLVLMNLPSYNMIPGPCTPLSYEDLLRLKDVGAQTVLHHAFWEQIHNRDGWQHLDDMVNTATRAGLKSIITTPVDVPANLPADWYACWRGRQPVRGVFSIWNRDAIMAMKGFLKAVIDRYSPDVLVIFAGFLSGECVLHNVPSLYDAAAVASYGGEPDIDTPETVEWLRRSVVDYFLEIDGFLLEEQPHQSTWNALQWLIAQQSKANGNFAQEDILRAEYEAWPDAERVLLQYTYYAHGEPYPTLVNKWKRDYELDVIVEAQYCEGLEASTPIAIERGFRGQVVCPLHPWAANSRVLTQEKVDAIAKSHRRWEEAHVS